MKRTTDGNILYITYQKCFVPQQDKQPPRTIAVMHPASTKVLRCAAVPLPSLREKDDSCDTDEWSVATIAS